MQDVARVLSAPSPHTQLRPWLLPLFYRQTRKKIEFSDPIPLKLDKQIIEFEDKATNFNTVIIEYFQEQFIHFFEV